jgi:malonyl-CoA O-methyltransferase
MQNNCCGFDKTKIAKAFSKAASVYDEVAILQQEVGNKLLDLLNTTKNQPATILDLGSGTGKMTLKLASLFPKAKVLGIDIATNMLQFAHNHCKKNNLHFIGADADRLPFTNNSIALITSNLMLQWSVNLKATLNEWLRVIEPGGKLFFSTLGSGSLHELRTSWKAVDNHLHVNTFLDKNHLIYCLTQMQLKNIKIKTANHYRLFNSLQEILLELKTLGAHNLQHRRPLGLFGKTNFKTLQEHYEKFRINGKLRTTYEVYYVSAIL